jgi:hypothetical protein
MYWHSKVTVDTRTRQNVNMAARCAPRVAVKYEGTNTANMNRVVEVDTKMYLSHKTSIQQVRTPY